MLKIEDGLYRGGRPTTPEERQALVDAGVRTILNLQEEWWEWFHGKTNDEVEWCAGNNILNEHIEISPLLIPRREALIAAVNIMRNSPRPLYVHCMEGKDRTGLAVASYRMIVNGWSKDDAVWEMKGCGYHSRYWFWLPVLNHVK